MQDYAFPDHSKLEDEIANVQAVKKSLFFVDFGSFPVGRLFRKWRGEG